MSADRSPLDTAKIADLNQGAPWVPADNSGAGLVLVVTHASYVRIGCMIFAFFNITFPATADASPSSLSGLPFTSKNNGSATAPVAIALHNVTSAIQGIVTANAKTFSFFNLSGAAVTNATLSGKNIRGCAVYEIDPGQ
jgi:hypothetical protein